MKTVAKLQLVGIALIAALVMIACGSSQENTDMKEVSANKPDTVKFDESGDK